MGSHYELREWLGKYYIVYRDDITQWQEKARELSYEEFQLLEEVETKHREEEQRLMRKLCEI